jgi:hypothetical protein
MSQTPKPARPRAQGTPEERADTSAYDLAANESDRPYEVFEACYRKLLVGFSECSLAGQGIRANVLEDHLRRLADLQSGAQHSQEQVRRDYIGDLQQAFGQTDAMARAGSSYGQYVTKAQQAVRETQLHYEEAERTLADKMNEIAQQNGAQCDAVFREYLKSVQSAWSSIDPATLTPPALARIAYALYLAASSAAQMRALHVTGA